jgi:integrase
MKLTEKRISDLKPAEREYFEWDDGLPGFGVRVLPSGAKSYVLKYRINKGGRNASQRRSSLGKPGVLSLDDARRIARRYLTDVAHGGDPFGDRNAYRTAPTVSDLLDRFLVEYVVPRRADVTAKEYRRLIEKHLRPALGRKKVAEVTDEDMERLHTRMKARPVQANRMLAVASKAFSLAEKWGMRIAHTNPCSKVERFPERNRERVFSTAEIEALGRALAAAEAGELPAGGARGKAPANPFAVMALRLARFLGLRIGEVRKMRWANVDLANGTARIAGKTGARTVFIPAPVAALLARAPRLGDCVIPGRKPDQPLDYKAIHKVWTRVAALANLENARIHDLRHTVATMAAGTGAGAHLVRDLLGHKTMEMANRYVSRMQEPVRELQGRVADTLAAAIEGNAGEVVPMKRGQ